MLPPRVAPIQAIICPIVMKSADQAELLKYAEDIKYLLKKKGIRADTDCRMNYTPGWKFNHWEQKGQGYPPTRITSLLYVHSNLLSFSIVGLIASGVPLRLEVGPRDFTNKQCRIVRRDNGDKSDVALAGIEDTVAALLDEVQASLFAK